jgi:hypothetical protein
LGAGFFLLMDKKKSPAKGRAETKPQLWILSTKVEITII